MVYQYYREGKDRYMQFNSSGEFYEENSELDNGDRASILRFPSGTYVKIIREKGLTKTIISNAELKKYEINKDNIICFELKNQ